MKYIVYKATNFKNKTYIGITCRSLTKRKSEHISRSKTTNQRYFHKALNKYDFMWSVLEKNLDYKDALKLEKFYIQLFNSNDRNLGYNLTLGGEGTLGHKMSEKTINLMKKNPKFKKIGKKNIQYLQNYYKINPDARSKIMKKWYSKEENKAFARNRRLSSIKKYGNNAGKPKRSINLINIENNEILKFDSLSEASKQTGVAISSLSNLINYKTKKVKKFCLLEDR